MAQQLAHKLNDQLRTSDVYIDTNITFAKMMLSDSVFLGLTKNGFVSPSPIQLRSIPLGLAGLDLMLKAKSGTGKTLVFSIIILEAFKREVKAPQSLIIVPTREIAIQIEYCLKMIGYAIKGFKVASFIGGLNIGDDRQKVKNCSAIVGTPGRINHLIHNGVINPQKIKILVLDEADKLMNLTFQIDLNSIFRCLPIKRQTIACSATYENGLDKKLTELMKNPIGVLPNSDSPLLIGVKQSCFELPTSDQISLNSALDMQNKVIALQTIFSTIPFKQCLVFSNSQSRAESYCNYLSRDEWPTEVITGAYDQKTRLAIFKKFRNFGCRILMATDLMARGVDSENVNLVINLEVPNDNAVYLHRIGRCGRFGSYGIAITLVSTQSEMIKFENLMRSIGAHDYKVLKRLISDNISGNFWDHTDDICETRAIKRVNRTTVDEQLDSDSLDDITNKNLNLLAVSERLVDKPQNIHYPSLEDVFDEFTKHELVKESSSSIIENGQNSNSICPPTNSQPSILLTPDNSNCDSSKICNDHPTDFVPDAEVIRKSEPVTPISQKVTVIHKKKEDFLKSDSSIASLVNSDIELSTDEEQEEEKYVNQFFYCPPMISHPQFHRKALQKWSEMYQNQLADIYDYLNFVSGNTD